MKDEGDPWGQLLEGGLALACTAQRAPVLETGRLALAAAFAPRHGLHDRLRGRLLPCIQAVIDREDDYEVVQLVRVLDDAGLLPVPGLREWLLASGNADVREVAGGVP